MSAEGLPRFLLSASLTYITAPAVRAAMLRSGTLDVPNHRSSHTAPTPRGGGLACLVGVTAALVSPPRTTPVRDLVAVGALAGVGLADDRTGGVDPRVRLLAQMAAGLVCGARHSSAVALASAVVVPGVVNVVNFMDGINGISGSTAAVWGTFAAVDRGSPMPTRALGAATAGAGVGFLPHNVPNATLFLGDVGSYLLGALMSVALVEALPQPSRALRLGAPLLPYAVDAAQALLRRARRGETLFDAHREHVYQRIVDEHGWSHTKMSLAHAAVACTIAVIARSTRPTVQIGGSAAVLTAYAAAPALLRRARTRKGDR